MNDFMEAHQQNIAATFLVPMRLLAPEAVRRRMFLQAIEPIQQARVRLVTLLPLASLLMNPDGSIEILPPKVPPEVARLFGYFDELVAAEARRWELA